MAMVFKLLGLNSGALHHRPLRESLERASEGRHSVSHQLHITN